MTLTVPIRVDERASRLRRPAIVAAIAAITSGVVILSGPTVASADSAVGLGQANAYSVIGGQAVTNTGPTLLEGGLATSPGTAITGFPPGLVGGATNTGNAVSGQLESDVLSGWTTAAGLAPDGSIAGDLVGQTLTSGVYKSTGPIGLSGTLTLDAQGKPNSVFVFQVASTLITASASHVAMINGAQPCNVFWQVGSSATLGTNSTFTGTIMALASVTVTTGVHVEGRTFAHNGAVTLDSDLFTQPGCDLTSGGTGGGTSSSTTSSSTTSSPPTSPADTTTTGATTPGSGSTTGLTTGTTVLAKVAATTPAGFLTGRTSPAVSQTHARTVLTGRTRTTMKTTRLAMTGLAVPVGVAVGIGLSLVLAGLVLFLAGTHRRAAHRPRLLQRH